MSTVNLLLSGIQSERIELREYDMRAGTVVSALHSLEWGLDRIEWLVNVALTKPKSSEA